MIPYTTNTTASIKIVFNSLNNFHINFPTLNLKLPQLKFYQSDRVQIDTDGIFQTIKVNQTLGRKKSHVDFYNINF